MIMNFAYCKETILPFWLFPYVFEFKFVQSFVLIIYLIITYHF